MLYLQSSEMASKVVVTYKRKRLFSRRDNSFINLHSDTPSEISALKTSVNFDNHDVSIAEYALLNKDKEFGIHHDYSEGNLGQQGENWDSEYHSPEKHGTKSPRLFPACTKQQDSSVPNRTEKCTLKQIRRSPKSDEILTYHPKLHSEGSHGKICQTGSAGLSNAEEKTANPQSNLLFVKSGSEDEDRCEETSSISPPLACSGIELDLKSSNGISSHQMKGTSISGTSTLQEANEISKDQCSSPCNNLGTKRKSTSTIITFSRRFKRNRDIVERDFVSQHTGTCTTKTRPAATCSVDLQNEKDVGNSPSFSAPSPATAVITHVDNSSDFPHGTAKNGTNAIAQSFQDSHEKMLSSLEGTVCKDAQDNNHINVRSQSLPSDDVNTERRPSDVSGKGDSLFSLGLSVSPHASRDIDCNLPLDCGSDQNHLPGPSEKVLHDSLGSSSITKVKENMPTFHVHCAANGSPSRVRNDKGKVLAESPPMLMGSSSKSKYNYIQSYEFQLFPENRSDDMPRLANGPQKTTQLQPSSSLQSSHFHGLSLQPEQMFNNHAYSSLYEWPNFPQVQRRETFQEFLQSNADRAQSFARHKMMFDSVLTRTRDVRRFGPPTTWSEEELDCLWIGVRRHGRGNWDAILCDRRLNFLPWKTAHDLAERWQEEQSRLFSVLPVPQVKYVTPPDFSSSSLLSQGKGPVDEVQLSLGDIQTRPSIRSMNIKKNKKLQKPITNPGTLSSYGYLSKCSWGLFNPSESSAASNANSATGNLPHWLKQAVEIPQRSSDLTQAVVSSVSSSGMRWLNQPNFQIPGNSHQPWLSNRYSSIQRKTEPQNGGKSPGNTNSPLVIGRGRTEPRESQVNNKQDDLIVIPSDASSEETISDDITP